MENAKIALVPAVVIAAILWSIAGTALGQADFTPQHRSTTPPPGARYEIVQSQLAAKLTFRLDRFTGHVWQLVRTPTDDHAWEATRTIDLPLIANPALPRFQIFSSGIAARFTFMIDTVTGQTWQFVTRSNKQGEVVESLWQSFK